MSDVMKALAHRAIPVGTLFKRFEAQVSVKNELNATDKNLAANLEDYRDPRLQHLKLDYSRRKLQPDNISFANDESAYRVAIDEIIKFNNFINEFNYVLEVANRLRYKLMPRPKTHVDWQGLFNMYDSNKSKFIEKAELGKMMRDAGMMATAAELTFVWNIINKFKGKMDSGTFIQWG